MGSIPQSDFIAEMGVTMKSLFVIAVAVAIFALCTLGVEARRPRRCNDDDDCTRGNRNGTCFNNRCFRSCDMNDECGKVFKVCDTNNSRCVMCNDDDDCRKGLCNTNKGLCDPRKCNSNENCFGGLVCDNDDCRWGLCNTNKNLCDPRRCNDNDNCFRGLV